MNGGEKEEHTGGRSYQMVGGGSLRCGGGEGKIESIEEKKTKDRMIRSRGNYN